MNKLFFRSNEKIIAAKVRVIDSSGKQLGIKSKEEAILEAKKKGLDLVEIAPKADPPVAKIVELSKFLYFEEKKLKAQAKKSKPTELKEIRFSPFIANNDYQNRIVRIKKFLETKHKIRLTVVFKGRQLGSRQFGYNLLKRITVDLGQGFITDSQPKWLGKHLQMIITPVVSAHKGVIKK